MTGPSDTAIEAGIGFDFVNPHIAHIVEQAEDRKRAVERAYPIIRADVIAEVVAALRDVWRMSIPPDVTHPADFIEREFREDSG